MMNYQNWWMPIRSNLDMLYVIITFPFLSKKVTKECLMKAARDDRFYNWQWKVLTPFFKRE